VDLWVVNWGGCWVLRVFSWNDAQLMFKYMGLDRGHGKGLFEGSHLLLQDKRHSVPEVASVDAIVSPSESVGAALLVHTGSVVSSSEVDDAAGVEGPQEHGSVVSSGRVGAATDADLGEALGL